MQSKQTVGACLVLGRRKSVSQARKWSNIVMDRKLISHTQKMQGYSETSIKDEVIASKEDSFVLKFWLA